MTTYNVFSRQHAAEDARVRRLYWICGSEEILRFLALDRIKALFHPSPYNIFTVSTRDTPEVEIWAGLNQHPLDSDQRRLYVVHGAEKLENLNPLLAWVKDPQTTRGRNTTAVFVSSDADWVGEEKEIIAKLSNAQVVRCSLPVSEEDKMKRAQEIVCAWGNINRISAGTLLSRVGFDLHEALAVMQKASLFPEMRVSVAAIQKLAPLRVDEDVVWDLLALQRRKAAEAIASPDTEVKVGYVLSSLSSHVAALARLYPFTSRSRLTLKEVAKQTQLREGYVRRLVPFSRHYPPTEVARRMRLLSHLDAVWHQGANEGVLESLVVQW